MDKFIPQARSAHVALNSSASRLPPIQGDRDRLAQVFNNLIDNAIKFTPPDGSVQISAASLGKFVEVKVTDTGAGIAPADQERIFERFYQADKSRRGGSHRGVGLGLAIARQIIQAHGGSLTVRSQPGSGSEFSVRLPLA
jgi:signal transduction histidine kinase